MQCVVGSGRPGAERKRREPGSEGVGNEYDERAWRWGREGAKGPPCRRKIGQNSAVKREGT